MRRYRFIQLVRMQVDKHSQIVHYVKFDQWDISMMTNIHFDDTDLIAIFFKAIQTFEVPKIYQ